MHPGTAQGSKLERLWVALATVAGLSLLEAAELAHGMQTSWNKARAAARNARAHAAHAGRELLRAALRVYGWELAEGRGTPYRAARVDGVTSFDAPSWWSLLRHARTYAADPQSVHAAVEKRHAAVLQAQKETDKAVRLAHSRKQSLSRLCARLRFHREAAFGGNDPRGTRDSDRGEREEARI